MLSIPIPFLGIKGIRKFAGKITDWPAMARDTEHLSHEVMKINILLEDQGTGVRDSVLCMLHSFNRPQK